MENDLQEPLDKRHEWILDSKYVIPYDVRIEDLPCTCRGEDQNACRLMLPVNSKYQVVVWNSCLRTVFASMKRQAGGTPHPAPDVIRQFHNFVDDYFNDNIEPLLRNFTYSAADWFNHNTRSQQIGLIGKEINNKNIKKISDVYRIVNKNIEDKPPKYEMFCKREVQPVEDPQDLYIGSMMPKTRSISMPDDADKFVLGPVCWRLEHIFSAGLDGYCGGKNWSEQEALISQMYINGYKYIAAGDASAWDKTQSFELKYVDRKIYSYLIDNDYIKHVDPQIFATKSLSRYREMVGSVREGDRLTNVIKVILDGTVMSGNSDTTLMNTARMILVIKFVLSQQGIEHKLWCKGDDFIIFLKSDVKLDDLFYKYWVKGSVKKEYINKPYGLGIVLKFLKTGPMSDFDFCSTNLIQDKNVFKMVRLPDRLSVIAHHSIKAMSLSKDEQILYMNDIATSLESWCGNMPFYGDYVQLIRKQYPLNTVKNEKIVNRVTKSKLQLSDGAVDNEREARELGHDNYHSARLRKSQTKVSDESTYRFLFEKYGMTKTSIKKHFLELERLSNNGILAAYKDWDIG